MTTTIVLMPMWWLWNIQSVGTPPGAGRGAEMIVAGTWADRTGYITELKS